jgi:hypothetical protein
MELTQSPLANELTLINQVATWGRYYSYEATITTEAEDLDVLKVVSVDWIRDYRNAVTDEILLQVALPSGEYLKRVLPFKENLRVTLTRTPIGVISDDDPRTITVQEYQAFIIATEMADTLGSNPQTATEDAANLVGFEKITLQLQELAWEQVRTEMVGGIFQRTTPFDLLISLLFNSIKELDVDVESRILGVNSVPPSNTVKRDHILIPHGVPLTSVAGLLQTQLGGIYSAGMGCYLQGGYWHVWPLYDNKRFDVATRTATFIILPDPRLRGTEKTYRATDRHLVAVITGGVDMVDNSESALLNHGNAVRFPDSNSMMESFVEKGGNKAVAKRTNNNTEYTGVQRRTGTQMSRVVGDMTKTNSYHESSKLAGRSGAFIRLHWENSEPSWITPDLQCEVGFTANGTPAFMPGIVVHAHVYSALAGTGLHQSAHQITTEVIVMVDRNSPEYQAFIEAKDNPTE